MEMQDAVPLKKQIRELDFSRGKNKPYVKTTVLINGIFHHILYSF